jgi:hypothetical protein
VPRLGSSTLATSDGLFGLTRNSMPSILYGCADQSFYLRELVRAVGAGHGALQRKLKRLTHMGVIVRRSQGNQVLFQASAQSPIFPENQELDNQDGRN